MIRQEKALLKIEEKYTSDTSSNKPDAIILSAGMMGKKIFYPKALIEYGGKTAIEHQINWLRPYVRKIIVACQQDESKYISEAIGKIRGVEFSKEIELLGTAGAAKKAILQSKADSFVVCNVDDLTDIDLNALIGYGTNTMCVSNPRLNFGVLETEGLDIRRYREKPIMRDVWANCGIYFLSRKLIESLPEKGSLEHDIWPFTRLKAFKHFGMWKTFWK